MKKILYIGNCLQTKSATPTSAETLGNLLKQEGFEVYTASAKKNKIRRLADMCWAVIKLRNWVDAVLIDTYSTQNFYYAVMVAWWCRRFKIPYFPILHGGNLPNRIKSSKKLSKNLFQNAATNVAPSNYMFHFFLENNFSNVVFIPNTIEIKNYPYLKRKEIQPKLLWVRSFSEIYNPTLALKVVEKLRTKYPTISLCMIGPEKDGSQKKCEEYAQKNNLPLTFTGKLTKKQWIDLSTEYDIFINTTNFDNTPVSVIEAMALGLPVVSTNVGGISYLLKEGEALLVPPNQVNEMATSVDKLLSDNELALIIAHNARKKAESFDWEVVKLYWYKLFLRDIS